MSLLTLLASLALAGPIETYEWDVSLNGSSIGERTLSVETADDGSDRRTLRVWTEINTSIVGRSVSFTQRLTAVASSGPAAFHSAVRQNGVAREYQGRRDAYGWTVTSVEGRGVRSEDLPANAVDLSTADLLDPGCRTPVWTYDEVRILTAEDGLIWQSPVSRLGTDDLMIGGQSVLVEGYEIEPPAGKMQLWYSASGVLVKYNWGFMGMRAEGVLRRAPAQTLDSTPAVEDGPVITEVEI